MKISDEHPHMHCGKTTKPIRVVHVTNKVTTVILLTMSLSLDPGKKWKSTNPIATTKVVKKV